MQITACVFLMLKRNVKGLRIKKFQNIFAIISNNKEYCLKITQYTQALKDFK